MENLYLDHAATTPMDPRVIETMTASMPKIFGNPSSIHAFGRQAHQALEESRRVIAAALDVSPAEIIFTSGGTEGDNTAIFGIARSRAQAGRHIITTAIEHPAVLEPLKRLEREGFEVTYLPVDPHGQIRLQDVKDALREDTTLVTIMSVNNEVGTILPIREIGALLANHPAVFHTDAVQSFGIQTVHPEELKVDLLNVSAHKFNGPKGVGFLYKRKGLRLPSMMVGGEQEEYRRAGTENLISIIGMAKAVALHSDEQKTAQTAQMASLRRQFLAALDAANISYAVHGDPVRQVPHILNLRFPGVNNQLLLMRLDLRGVAVSTGSACTAGTVEPSHVLAAMFGASAPELSESIRISLGCGIGEKEIAQAARILIEELNNLKK